jgi:hypothetical protein
MKLKVLFLILGFLLLFLPFSSAQEQKIDVNIDIITYEIKDVYVVGDFFYYKINLTNTGIGIINDTVTISVVNPSGVLIGFPQTEKLFMEPHSSILIIAKGGKGNETAAFPFDVQGDYKIEINSTQPIDFNRTDERFYIRQNQHFNYSFDVMPRWQHTLWKNTEEASQKIIEANQKLLNLTGGLVNLTGDLVNLTKDLSEATIRMENATKSVERASWIMAFVAVITLIIAYKTYKK